jgi:hypothetical protein
MVTTSMGRYVFTQAASYRIRMPNWNFQRTHEVLN